MLTTVLVLELPLVKQALASTKLTFLTLAVSEGKTTSVHCSKVTSYHKRDGIYLLKSFKHRFTIKAEVDINILETVQLLFLAQR